jgi:hypothetical protein
MAFTCLYYHEVCIRKRAGVLSSPVIAVKYAILIYQQKNCICSGGAHFDELELNKVLSRLFFAHFAHSHEHLSMCIAFKTKLFSTSFYRSYAKKNFKFFERKIKLSIAKPSIL